jgi:hypothetical protein
MKLIPLTQGKAAMVDDADHEWLLSFGSWYAVKGRKTFYAARNVRTLVGRQTRLFMHAALLGTKGRDIFPDHADGNGLNNQRCNLRLATPAQNNANVQGRGVSKFRGVTLRKNRPACWKAVIGSPARTLGCFLSEEDAARAYDAAAKVKYGEYARLNFPLERA